MKKSEKICNTPKQMEVFAKRYFDVVGQKFEPDEDDESTPLQVS